jgi:hypothetical protein
MAEQERALVKPVLPAELELAATEDEAAPAQPQVSKPPSQEVDDALPGPLLSVDTENLTAKADTVPRTPKKPASRQLRRAKALERARQKRRRLLWWWGGITGGLLLLLLGVLGWTFTPRKTQEVTPVPPSRPPLFVSHSGKHGTPTFGEAFSKAEDKDHINNAGRPPFRTISEAISKAEDKDQIVVLDDVEEQLELTDSKKDLLVEAAPGKTLVWRFPRNVASGTQLVLLNNVSHLRIRGFTFDGSNRVDRILTISGNSPGLRLQDVHLRGFRYFAIFMANAAGTADQPITFDHVQALTSEKKEAAVTLWADERVASPKINQHILFSDCRFDGSFKNPVLVFGDTSLVKDLVFRHTRPPVVFTKQTH